MTGHADTPPSEGRAGAEPSVGPLQGYRVIELGSLVAGPFAGRLLGDYGADVIKVEAPDRPDPLRDWGQQTYRGHGLWWTVHGRNKRCVTMDLRVERGQELFKALVRHADVVVENFRPGTLERWSLGWDELSAINPGLILARLSGYGQTGPYAHRAGYASVAEAMGGLRAINGFPDGPPVRMAVSLGDSLGGMMAVQGVLAALLHRERSGRGQIVDIALTEACLALTESMIPEYDRLGRIRRAGGTRLDGIAPSNLFKSKDGQWLIVAANQDTVFRRLCTVIGRPELADDPRFANHSARGQHQDDIEHIVAEWVKSRSAAEVIRVLEGAGVVVGPVYTAADVVADPHYRARAALVAHHDERVEEDVLGPGVVPIFSATPGTVRWAGPPHPGSHNEHVFCGLLGMTGQTLRSLRHEGVI
ncbi:CaiB/BaiF CoA transferase family protein [Mycobacterium paraintracellulare]|uniref:CaiB/BaiF CoA transferase family protein n=2 Tax=Mycobacterium avium complex (MAC) TaxID=120793 RepID=UPI001928C7BA